MEDASGFHELDAFARDDVERGHLVDDGFEIGHVALFLPPDSVDGDPPLTNDSVIVQGIAGLFHDADGAGSSLERYVEDLRTRQVPGAIDVPADGLGDHVVRAAWRDARRSGRPDLRVADREPAPRDQRERPA